MERGAEIFDGEAKESVDCENGVDGVVVGVYYMDCWVDDTLTIKWQNKINGSKLSGP